MIVTDNDDQNIFSNRQKFTELNYLPLRDEHLVTLQKVLADCDTSIDNLGTVANESYENMGPDGGV